MQTIEEIYTLTVRELKPMERLQLATRILKDLRPAQSEQVDYSEEWTEEDLADLRAHSLRYVATLYPDDDLV